MGQSNEYAYIYCPGNRDIFECGNQWMYYSNYYSQWLRDDSSYTWNCGAGAVNVDFECDDREIYGNTLCVHNFAAVANADSNETAWRLGELCENSQPSFYFNDVMTNVSYFLSYETYRKYIDD